MASTEYDKVSIKKTTFEKTRNKQTNTKTNKKQTDNQTLEAKRSMEGR